MQFVDDTSILKILAGPIEPSFAILLIFVGLYSIGINANYEKSQNYTRSAAAARIGGWCYIIGGASLLIILQL